MKTNERNQMRRRLAARVLMLSLAACAAAHAGAQSAGAGEAVQRSEVGHSTAAWLELQRSNAQAAAAQPMLGEEAGLAYRRYMQSFKSRIPDLYGSALNQGSGSGQGGGLTGTLPQN
ncbi:MAG: FIG00452862: hypothetical protein [uncultured Paraburkholderia sp.]|nr:MAG: FIG00452862: hypothetical protein [uncultured Paraburkholderia sp.]CAH2788943.1 MAG: FIG00452862: hypothetical protein [uncultured Paraburkholderia sp.]CAH2894262.1 MAG: FIG00452862: hypothetical protein [uncultured Paraburkholderia sp.]CAH2923467.1 MAG: FIG00452862: hypothetical protein [uncultured Paraburkholderia sp.]CAH2923939.1 MAG: FIG00452862: hypothetical protein [uncultured Paraburkholderia sp.]